MRHGTEPVTLQGMWASIDDAHSAGCGTHPTLTPIWLNLTRAAAMLSACLLLTACNRDEPGCTDSGLNYDAEATTDDGGCTYDTTGSGEGGGIVTAECEDTVSMDGYDYAVVAIGSQCWFAENLKTTVFPGQHRDSPRVRRGIPRPHLRGARSIQQQLHLCGGSRLSLQWICCSR